MKIKFNLYVSILRDKIFIAMLRKELIESILFMYMPRHIDDMPKNFNESKKRIKACKILLEIFED